MLENWCEKCIHIQEDYVENWGYLHFRIFILSGSGVEHRDQPSYMTQPEFAVKDLPLGRTHDDDDDDDDGGGHTKHWKL